LILLTPEGVVAEGPPREVLREEVLSRAYGVAVHVGTHDRTGDPIVLPIPTR
jgi:ABC-type cobalamin/Fe3+-siderophores transport system ATPase subunit